MLIIRQDNHEEMLADMATTWQQFSILLKRLSGVVSDGMLFSGRPHIVAMDLERDFPEIDRIFQQEEWPFVKSDLEVSIEQPRAAAYVARKAGKFAGFFAAHDFGDVGYLNMMIIAQDFRNKGVARPLYFRVIRELKNRGIKSLALYATRDSTRIVRLLGFHRGQTFTLLAKDPNQHEPDTSVTLEELSYKHLDEIVNLDAAVFGVARPAWVGSLLRRRSNQFYGVREDGRLLASVCIRPRKDDALCIDMTNATDFQYLDRLLGGVLSRYRNRSVMCFVKTDGKLHEYLVDRGFSIPGFFEPVGPLTEWTKGNIRNVGRSNLVQCLSWF